MSAASGQAAPARLPVVSHTLLERLVAQERRAAPEAPARPPALAPAETAFMELFCIWRFVLGFGIGCDYPPPIVDRAASYAHAR